MSRQGKVQGLFLPESAKQVQSELFTLTYGILVTQVLEDIEDPVKVNAKLEKIGNSIGTRLIDDIFARNLNLQRCKSLSETAEAIGNYGFKPYLGVTPKISDWSERGDEFTLVLDKNPLTEFVELN